MHDQQSIHRALSKMQSYQGPMLSLYMKLDSAHIGSDTPHNMAGIKSTLEHLANVPRRVIDAVLGELHRSAVSGDGIAIFANESELDIIPIDVDDLPIVDPSTGRGKARWGRPYVAPLIAMESQHRPHCVVFVDSNRFRCFLVQGQKIDEVMTKRRTPAPEESEPLSASKQVFPAYVATRGGAAYDKAQQHLEILIERFYDEIAAELMYLLESKHHASLIVIGPERELARIERVWPHALVEEIAAKLPSLPSPMSPPARVLEHVTSTIAELERCHQARLCKRVREEGIVGLSTCLRAIQRGQVHTAIVPWPMEGTVYREVESGYVATTRGQALAFIPQNGEVGEVEEVALDDVLVTLAHQYNVKLEFTSGEHRQILEDEFGGIGALLRW